jgi:hypothetical protein
MATPTQHIVTFVPDPWWWVKLLAVAAILALPLTIGAHRARARRISLALTFPIAVAALLAGHFVAPISMDDYGLFAAIAAELFVFFLGVKYILGTRLIPASILAVVTTAVLLVATSIAVFFPLTRCCLTCIGSDAWPNLC